MGLWRDRGIVGDRREIGEVEKWGIGWEGGVVGLVWKLTEESWVVREFGMGGVGGGVWLVGLWGKGGNLEEGGVCGGKGIWVGFEITGSFGRRRIVKCK
jgi:hypothetical protein